MRPRKGAAGRAGLALVGLLCWSAAPVAEGRGQEIPPPEPPLVSPPEVEPPPPPNEGYLFRFRAEFNLVSEADAPPGTGLVFQPSIWWRPGLRIHENWEFWAGLGVMPYLSGSYSTSRTFPAVDGRVGFAARAMRFVWAGVHAGAQKWWPPQGAPGLVMPLGGLDIWATPPRQQSVKISPLVGIDVILGSIRYTIWTVGLELEW